MSDSCTITFTEKKRAQAIVDIEIDWEVSREHIDKLVASGMALEEAIEYSLSNNACTQMNYNCEVDEIVMEHESSIQIV